MRGQNSLQENKEANKWFAFLLKPDNLEVLTSLGRERCISKRVMDILPGT